MISIEVSVGYSMECSVSSIVGVIHVNPCSISPLILFLDDVDSFSDSVFDLEYVPKILPSKDVSSIPRTGE